MPLYNVSEGFFDQLRRKVAFDAPPYRDIQRSIPGFELVQNPEAVLRQGGRILNVTPHLDPGRRVRPLGGERRQGVVYDRVGVNSSYCAPFCTEWKQAPQLTGAQFGSCRGRATLLSPTLLSALLSFDGRATAAR